MNSDSLNMVSRLGEGHMPGTFFLSEPQLKTTVCYVSLRQNKNKPCQRNLMQNGLQTNMYNVHKSQFKSIHMLRKKIFSEKDIKIFIGTYI